MSSGRSGAPGEQSGPEPSLDPWGRPPLPPIASPSEGAAANQAVSDLPALPFDSLPPAGRLPFDASERGLFGATSAPQPGQTAQEQARASLPFPPPSDEISGIAAAQLFGQTSRQTARQRAIHPFSPFSAFSQTSQTSQTSQVRQPEYPSAPAGAFEAPAPPAERAPGQTLTQQIRSVQPPDVARQAINELNVLAGEMIMLAQELEQSGLARMHAGAYLDIARRYGELARQAWLSVAAERLEQDGASQDYRQLVVGIARDITRLRRESEVAASNEQFPLPRRRPFLWRSRSGAISRALAAWQSALGVPPDPRQMGLALFELRGALNTASVAPLEFSLLNLLSVAALWLAPLSGLAAGMASVAYALMNHPLVSASYALVTLLAFMLWTILLLGASRGRVTLMETLAGICFSETRSACNGRDGSRFVAVTLRVWWLLIGGVGALLTLAAFIGSGFALDRFNLLAPLAGGLPRDPITLLLLTAELLAVVVAPAALAATAALVALATPTLVVNALRFAREMAGSRRWSPAARRYTLAPALATLAYLTSGLVALAWLLAGRMGLAHMALVSVTLGPALLTISERAPLLALALALPYLALIELPFRLGLGAWRRAWLHDLRTRHTTIEAHVRRLSAPDPRTGAPDTSEETLRAMQYDLVLLQFYTARITEAERASASPFGLGGTLAILLIVIAGALLLDGGAHTLAQALTIRLAP